MAKHHRFATLDGLRGVAALAVATGHLEASFGGAPLQHYGMAVDFFFVLSGFVLAHAYFDKLQGALTPRAFMRRRLIRMYPLYIFGTLLFAIYAGARVTLLHDFPLSMAGYAVLLLCAGLFLPTLIQHPERPDLYPLNAPAWSLLFELLANVAFALSIRRLTVRMLLAVVAIGFIAQGILALHYGSFSMGWNRATFFGGLARVTFSFFSGVLVYRLWQRRPFRWNISPLLLIAALLAVMAVPTGAGLRVPYEVTASLAFPVLVYLGASSMPRPALRTPFLEAGAMSYALYTIHAPIIMICSSISAKLLGADLPTFAPWGGIVLIVFMVILAASTLR